MEYYVIDHIERLSENQDAAVCAVDLEVPGNIDHRDARISTHQQKQLQQLSPLVVKRSLPPVFDHELGNKDGDLTIGMVTLDFQDVLDERRYDEAVG